MSFLKLKTANQVYAAAWAASASLGYCAPHRHPYFEDAFNIAKNELSIKEVLGDNISCGFHKSPTTVDKRWFRTTVKLSGTKSSGKLFISAHIDENHEVSWTGPSLWKSPGSLNQRIKYIMQSRKQAPPIHIDSIFLYSDKKIYPIKEEPKEHPGFWSEVNVKQNERPVRQKLSLYTLITFATTIVVAGLLIRKISSPEPGIKFIENSIRSNKVLNSFIPNSFNKSVIVFLPNGIVKKHFVQGRWKVVTPEGLEIFIDSSAEYLHDWKLLNMAIRSDTNDMVNVNI